MPQTAPDVSLLTPLDQARSLVRQFVALLPNLALAAVTLAVSWVVARYAARFVEAVMRRANQNPTAGLLLGRLATYVVLTVGVLVALSTVFPSFQARDLIQLLGISGVAVGFAFKDIFQNFLAGVIILVSRPFRIGDTIAVKGYEGTVEDIQTRATMLRTADNQRIVVPNTVLFSEEVTVRTAYASRRTEIDLGIAYSRDLEAARAAAQSAIGGVPDVLGSPAPDVLVVGFTDTRATLRLRVWTACDANLPVVRDEVARAARSAMADAGIALTA